MPREADLVPSFTSIEELKIHNRRSANEPTGEQEAETMTVASRLGPFPTQQ